MPNEDLNRNSSARRLLVDLTEAEHRMLEDIAKARGVSVEAAASELAAEEIAEKARKAAGTNKLSAAVTRFHRAQRDDS